MIRFRKRDSHTKRLPSSRFPPGRTKIADALRLLMEKKEFNIITTGEIARTAGVAEALIYKYFRGKRDLLHQVLQEYLEAFVQKMKGEITDVSGFKDKLRKVIWIHFNLYSTNRVFSKILLLEVRNYPGYFESGAYQIVKDYANLILELIEGGVKSGDIRDDVPPSWIRQFILGGIEHFVLPRIIFDLEISEDVLTENLCKLIFNGIERNPIRPQQPLTGPSKRTRDSVRGLDGDKKGRRRRPT